MGPASCQLHYPAKDNSLAVAAGLEPATLRLIGGRYCRLCYATALARQEGLEPPTCGFGDHRSSN